MFVSIKPLHVSVFFHDHLQGVLRCALCRDGTKHSGGPPEEGREKRPKRVGVLYLQTRF